MDATDDVSVAIGITLESFQAVTYEMAKKKVYLRQIMDHLSLPMDVIPMGSNPGNKSGASSKTTGKMPQGKREYRTRWNDPGIPCKDLRRIVMHKTMKGT